MKSRLFPFLAGVTAIFLAYGLYQALEVAPTEATMGDVQRIFYMHVPAAATAFTLFFVNFVASIYYLARRSSAADALAVSAAEAGVVFCLVVLITGPIWARYAWGVWWAAWDMRLNTTLILWLLYVSYLVLRRSSEEGATSTLAAALAIFAFLDVPVVYMANRWFRTNHPQPVIGNGLDPQMGAALGWNMIAFLLFGALIVWCRYELERTEQTINAIHVQKLSRGSAMLLLPAMLLFQTPHRVSPYAYLYGGYIATWTIYIGYLLLLLRKLLRLKREEAALRG